MKLLLPLEAIIEHQHIVSEISNFINITESLAEINEQIKTVDKDDEYISNLIQFFESFREYIRNKEYDEEVKVLLKPNEGVDDPFPVFLLLINASILMFIKTHLQKILANNIDEIEISISDKIKTDFNNNSKYTFTELTNSINWAMKSITSYVLNVSYPGRIVLVILQIIPKIIGIFERFQSIVNIDSLTDDEIFERLLDKETLCMLNFNLDPALFERYDFTSFELKQLDKIHFAVIDSAEIAKENKNNGLNGEEVYYFIEHIDELQDEIFHYKDIIGISYNSDYFYKQGYIEINNKLRVIVDPSDVCYECISYNIDFFYALDPKLPNVITSLKKNEEKYICLICEDNYIIQKIKAYFSGTLMNDFIKKSAIEVLNTGPLGNNYLMIHGIDELTSDQFHKLWTKIKQRVFREGFVIFTANKIPVNIYEPENFAAHEWKFDRKLLEKNFSKILHAIISEVYKNKVKVTEAIIGNINSNRYRILFPPNKIDIKCLHDAIHSQLETMNFDYNSARSWYSIINSYQENLESPKTNDNNHENRIVSFVLNGKQWLIGGLLDDKNDNNVVQQNKCRGMFYLVIALLYNQEYQKGINYHHLITLADYYETRGKKSNSKILERIKLEESIRNRESHKSMAEFNKSEYSTINGAFFGSGTASLEPETQYFIEKHIELKGGRVCFVNQGPENSFIFKVDKFELDKQLFKNDYLNILKKRLKG